LKIGPLDNAWRALSNLLIARTRLIHHDKYDELCTQSGPTCHTSKIRHRKHNYTILNTAAKNLLRAPTYFYNPLFSFRSAPSFSTTPASPDFRPAPLTLCSYALHACVTRRKQCKNN